MLEGFLKLIISDPLISSCLFGSLLYNRFCFSRISFRTSGNGIPDTISVIDILIDTIGIKFSIYQYYFSDVIRHVLLPSGDPPNPKLLESRTLRSVKTCFRTVIGVSLTVFSNIRGDRRQVVNVFSN